MKEQKYPVSTSDFERIRREGYLYVDKTAYIHTLVKYGVFYFLGRPRRFGKSLLLSTLEAYFLGKRDLFKGLAIDKLEPEEWTAYPVLHLDMSREAFIDKSSLQNLLEGHLIYWEKELGIIDIQATAAQRFVNVIRETANRSGKKVVILIDEYDSPLSASIDNPELLRLYREQLHGFYTVLKSLETHIQFCMLTGVTKFGKVSVFSGLNNLKDISLSDRYAGICGITEEELRSYFSRGIKGMANKYGWSEEETLEKLKYNYDGYHFSEGMTDIYNPYSLLNAMADKKIGSFWCASGLPTLLSKSLMEKDYDVERLNGSAVSVSMLENISVYSTEPEALFYQTGYLTIKDYDPETELFTLGYPNREVERGILNDILRIYSSGDGDVSGMVTLMRESLRKGRPEEFVRLLKSFLSGIPSKLRSKVSKYENYYHTIFYCITSLIGLDVNAEYNTSEGFIDILVKTPDYIYVIELKVNGTAEDAIRQIELKNYADPFYTGSGKNIYKIGIGFSKSTHNIETYKICKD
ncbi:MAG: ATP-binding protein [Muribaculaceae bacterium]|nr:ATP-binding protein [Muribaculaceae bacterium]